MWTSHAAAWRWRAATRPSPPLLPRPATTRILGFWIAGSREASICWAERATAAPAFSIRRSDGTPNSSVARRSRSRISAATTALIPHPSSLIPLYHCLGDRVRVAMADADPYGAAGEERRGAAGEDRFRRSPEAGADLDLAPPQ